MWNQLVYTFFIVFKNVIDICTCDVDYSRLTVNYKAIDPSLLSRNEKKKFKVLGRIKRNELKDKILKNKTKISNLFKTDSDLVTMREPFIPVQHYFLFAKLII